METNRHNHRRRNISKNRDSSYSNSSNQTKHTKAATNKSSHTQLFTKRQQYKIIALLIIASGWGILFISHLLSIKTNSILEYCFLTVGAIAIVGGAYLYKVANTVCPNCGKTNAMKCISINNIGCVESKYESRSNSVVHYHQMIRVFRCCYCHYEYQEESKERL